ncbi:MAG TPA: adenylate/guanylate cyclase domain-containing protein [Aggregatilineales bacterium]|nr:adenylate/guanylate cyclase domain-containing protein [Aggregatilineales bacterium]
MTDTTTTITPFEVETLRTLLKDVSGLEGILRAERSKLQKLGMSLPPGTLAGLQAVRAEFEALLKHHETNLVELSRLRELSRTAALINSTLDLNDVLNEVMDTVISLTRAERGYVVLKNPETGELEFRVARDVEHRTMSADELIVSKTVIGGVAKTGIPVVTTNAEHDPRFENEKSIVNYALRSILCVPLILKGTITGVVYTDNRVKQGLFGEQEMTMLQTFANQAAVAIENARLYERLQANIGEITAINNLLDNVFASISSGIITVDAEGIISQVNDAACHILALSSACVGHTIWSQWEMIHAETLRTILEDGIDESIEIEAEIAGRGLVSLALRLSPLYGSGEAIEGVVIVVDDLTESKQREAKLEVVRRYLPPAMVDNIHSIDRLGLGGERRYITTIYVDVRNFNQLSRELSPQDFMNVLNRYLTVASDEIIKQTGVIDKYMGSEVMGLFNTQLNPAETDHPWRGLHAALNAADEYVKFYRQQGEPDDALYFRIGIHAGIATLGNVGSEERREFTAIGDAINLTHRLLENANTGEIMISDETWEACREHHRALPPYFKVGDPEQLYVKGRREPITVRRIKRL